MNKLGQYKYLFLDRDGVINVERPNDYVKTVSEFVFTENAAEAIAMLSNTFDRIFVITNQRGIGRGIMSNADLDSVHHHMLSAIQQQGGKVDKIYYCTHLSPTSVNRKPNIGMAFEAQVDFPEIRFAQSIMVGNSRSDIEFGNKLGMHTVLVGDKYPENDKIYQLTNDYYKNLHSFVLAFGNA